MIDPSGIAHIQLTVHDMAAGRPFCYRLLHETLGMAVQYDVAGQIFYCIGGRTGVLIRAASVERRDTPFDQTRIGLHHFCFRLRSRQDVDALDAAMADFGANIIRTPEERTWAGNLDRIKDAPLTPEG